MRDGRSEEKGKTLAFGAKVPSFVIGWRGYIRTPVIWTTVVL